MEKKLAQSKSGLPAEIHFHIISKLNRQIITTKGYWNIIINIKHPSVKGKEDKVKETIKNPDSIRQNYTDKKIYLFYKKYKKNYLCVIVRHLNGKGFIITIYFTDKIKEGRLIWQKK